MNEPIIKKLNQLGYHTLPGEWYDRVDEWKQWYVGDVKAFHTYRRYNGNNWRKAHRASMGMAKKVCEDWANLLMNEKVKVTLEGEKEQAFVDQVFDNNNLRVRLNEAQELKSAYGTVAYIPRVINQTAAGGADIEVDVVTVEHIFPLHWENGQISECAFSSVLTNAGHDYVYLQIHTRDERGSYMIENQLYRYDNGFLTDAALADVPGYNRIPPVVYTGRTERQFVIDKPNLTNNVNYHYPIGIPVFANAIDALRGVDCAFDNYINELDNGQMVLMVKMAATRWEDGEPTFDADDRRFYLLPEDTQQGSIVEPIVPSLRTQQLSIGLQDQLNILASKCGLGERFYRLDGGSVSTATQVISENSNLFRTIKKHEIVLEAALKELCRVILRLGNDATGAGLDENVEISVDFDDSIIEDKNADFQRDLQLLNAGILNDWEFRAKWMNEDEATAKAALPKVQEMVDEEQQEVE